MRLDRKRLRGAAVFAVLCSALFSDPLLRGDRGVDIAGLIGALLASGLVGYLAWPGIEITWGQRDRRDDGKRVLYVGLGLVAGLVVVRAVSALAGDDAGMWSFFLLLATLAAVFIAVSVQVWRARRS